VVGLATVAEEALVTVHRFRPELALVDAPIDLDDSPHGGRPDLEAGDGHLAMRCSLEPAPGGAIKLS